MIYYVTISDAAERDMKEISDYISDELYSPEAAFKLMQEIREQIRGLNTMPKKFALVDDKRLADRGIRSITVKNHILFYVVNDQSKTVTVVSVMYARRNWINLL